MQTIPNPKREEEYTHPHHYRSRGAIEPITLFGDYNMDAFSSVILKYLCRYRWKGTPIKDLEKAIYYTEKWLEALESEGLFRKGLRLLKACDRPSIAPANFISSQSMDHEMELITLSLLRYSTEFFTGTKFLRESFYEPLLEYVRLYGAAIKHSFALTDQEVESCKRHSM